MVTRRLLYWLRQVVPPPRRPFHWRQALLPVGFLLVYAVVAWQLEARQVLLYTAPAAFALMLLAPVLWWWDLAGYSGLTRQRGICALLIRLTALGLLAMLLAEPRAVRQHDSLGLIFAVDLSDSIAEPARDRALEWVAKVASVKPEKDAAGLVVFAADAAVELPPRQTFPFEAINSRLDRDGTDISSALSLSGALVRDDQQGRVVLISDGTSTEGSLDQALDDLAARGIAVDVLPIDYALEREVWLEKLDLPLHVVARETYEASVVLSALTAGEGTLVLRENGTVIAEQEVSYRAGKNRFTLPLYLRGPGYYEYTATVSTAPEDDFWAANNTAVNHLRLEGEGQVLLVVDAAGDPEDYRYLEAALREAGRMVTVIDSYEMPRTALSLDGHDCVIAVNVPAESLDAVQQQAIHDAVYHLGVGFIMVGGENSFGPGGFHRTPIEDALPVEMDIKQKKVLPKGALAIILHTCEFPQGNTWAKRITQRAMQVLGAQDEIGVLVFDWNGGNRWLFPLTPAAEYARLSKLLNGAQIGDMPDFHSTMQMGLNGLQKSDAATKHMIIISDGDASAPSPQLLQDFRLSGVSVSTVTVFPHGNVPTGVMPSIANVTGGRHYFPKDPQTLPSIFIKEAKTIKRSMIQNLDFVPEVGHPSSILKGVSSMPQLRGYVVTTLKPRGQGVLVRTTPEEDQDPVLATWNFGLGKSAAFTGDLGSRWASQWISWDRYQAFCDQLVAEVSRVTEPTHVVMSVQAAGDRGEVVVEDHHPDGGLLEFQAQVLDPDGEASPIRLEQVGPGRYVGSFPIDGRGHYQVLASAAGQGRNERSSGSLVIPYAPEYLRFRANPMALGHIAERTGGRELNGADDPAGIWALDREARSSSRPIFDWFLIMLACLFLGDVAVRRIQLDWSVIAGWFRRKSSDAPSSETMGALLKRKQRAGTRRDEPVVPAMLTKGHTPAKPTAPATKLPGTEEVAKKPAPKPERADDGSTMSRLLARKRQLQQEEQDDD